MNLRPSRSSRLLLLPLCGGLLSLAACGDDGGAGAEASESGSTEATQGETGVEATGTGEVTGETGDGDGDTSGDGDGDGVPACPHTPVDGDPAPELVLVATGWDQGTLLLAHPTDPERLFVGQQDGQITVLAPGAQTKPTDVFMQVPALNTFEMGLLGMAFHPNFPADPRFYLNYNPDTGADRTRISEFSLDAGDPSRGDLSSERVLLEISQPYRNHNGGALAFGPDGNLYIGVGDGGDADDPLDAGLDLDTHLGKILRIDVEPDGANPYTIPSDNPFVGQANTRPEIFAYGMRNPWRLSFDSANGDFYVADVGQNQYEEINIVVNGGNYGWSDMEGFHCFQGANCDDSSSTPNALNADSMYNPIIEYDHAVGRSVTGGYVYRSCEVPAWEGRYIYGDFGSSRVWQLSWDGTAVSDAAQIETAGGPGGISSFGTNAWGDVYLLTYGSDFDSGAIYRLAPQTP